MKVKNLLFEAIGTFVLTFSIGMSDNYLQQDQNILKSLSYFIVYLAFFQIGKKISGCHLNPIVSFAMFFVKKLDAIQTLGYTITQFSVAIVASFLVKACTKQNKSTEPTLELTMLKYSILESISSWIFVLAFLKASE